MRLLVTLICLAFFFPKNVNAQSTPSDFNLEITTRGQESWGTSGFINISVTGQSEYIESKSIPPQILLDTTFALNSSNVARLWQTIQDNNYFSLDSSYIADSLYGGSIALITVTANGITKQVFLSNAAQQSVQNIIDTVNSLLPTRFYLDYSVPEKVNAVPTDPCNQLYSFDISNKSISPKLYKKLEQNYNRISSVKDVVQIPHGGVEIGYQMSLRKAVSTGHATLKSKGDYFGDAVAITGDNTKNFPPSDNTIHIKLNLEFYGECDNAANEAMVTKDIYDKWNGQTTSSGKKIEINISVLSDSGITSPPGTPGYDDIKLACGNGRSYVWGLGDPNSDKTNTGTWYMGSESVTTGAFGHEAGHLMGLDDQYQDWKKLPDGTWQNVKTGQELSYNDFVNYFNSKFPDYSYSANKDLVDNSSLLSVPLPGHRNDLMFDETKPPTQTEIDQLASSSGLIINIKAGDILSNKDNDEQNLLITHTGDLFLKPGEVKTLNGIYTACIDAYRGAPSDSVVFDVAPPLSEWGGIPSAQYLLKLARFVDSTKRFCGYDFDTQDAVWRISDNVTLTSSADSLFKMAGINLENNLFHFPKMINNSTNDSTSGQYIPEELFVPEIQPKSVQANIGDNLNFNAKIYQPSGANDTTDFSWLLNYPPGSSSKISQNGNFVPDKTGIYDVSVKINVNGSDTASYIPALKSYAVVPDKFTETFEHPNLTDKYSWQTYGDTKWHITNSEAETGSYSASSGPVLYNQTSTIQIFVDLPKDSSITFAVKLLSNEGSTLQFDVDSNFFDEWAESMDWHFYSYPVSAGKHLLSWQLSNSIDGPSEAWLDNIFFPDNTIVTGINRKEEIPLKFNLYQNYPNPFNPSTEIKFTTAKPGIVKLSVYNTLGQKVIDLINNYMTAGEHTIDFNAKSLSSGIYFYKLTAGAYSAVKKMILLK